jgi:hypothetical protein
VVLRATIRNLPLKPLAIRAEIYVSDVRAVAAASSYSFKPWVNFVDVDEIVVRGHCEQLSIRAEG